MPTMSRVESAFCRSAPWRQFTRRLVLPWVLQGVRPSGHALEIGAGSGAMAAEILSANPDLRMTVTDYDEAIVADAGRRLERFDNRATVRQADAVALPFNDGSFDVVLTFIMLHHKLRWEAALAEATRVLRPGGRLVGYDLVASWPMRMLQRVEGSEHRMIGWGELNPVLDGLPLSDFRVRVGLGGVVVRFNARRERVR